MSKIKAAATVVLSRDAVEQFFNDELLDYGVLDGLAVQHVSSDDSDDRNFLTIHLMPKPEPEKQ